MARHTMAILRLTFRDQLIYHNGVFDWPPTLQNLTAPDFFLWRNLQQRVYANRLINLEELNYPCCCMRDTARSMR